MGGPQSPVESQFRLELLGGARLSGPTCSVGRLERKTAALLAYVALEKDATRAKVAALLWPDVAHATARNNLAQVLARLKKLAGSVIVAGKDALSLVSVSVDVAELELAVQRARLDSLELDVNEQLLGGYEFEECPELMDWLEWRREQHRRTMLRALELESRRLEAERDFAGAIQRTEEALSLNRLVEITYRRLMSLHAARGDRARALDVFADCERMLRDELGTSPSHDTQRLVERLRQESPRPIPLDEAPAASIHYDQPKFVGRAAEWAAAERAYRRALAVFVSGEPGIGKTRFLLEFAHSKGPYLLLEGRPGDAAVPFSALSRGLRHFLRDGASKLSDWARSELSRILPELGGESGALRSEVDKIRLLDAALELIRRGRGDARTIVFDDLHFCDAASIEAMQYALSPLRQEPNPTPLLFGYRRGELSREVSAWIAQTLESGGAASIELQGLESEAIWQLAESLAENPRERVPELAKASLGNPLFVSEILRSMQAGDRPVVIPARVERLLERRLERLSPAALRLARVAAVLGSELNVEIAAKVMDQTPLDLDEAWAELEREQVIAEGRFVHDLLAETLEHSLSRALRSYLHGLVAGELAERRADPAIVARHFELGGDELKAAPFMQRAAEHLRTLSRLEEAAEMFERAGDIFVRHGEVRSAISAWFAVGRFLRALDRGDRFQRLVERMNEHARSDGERARALVVRASYEEGRDEVESAERHAAQAYELATQLGHGLPRAEALRMLFTTRVRQGRVNDAERVFREFREMCRASGEPEAEIAALWHGAELLAARDRHLDAIGLCHEADAIVSRVGRLRYVSAAMAGLIARSDLALGRTLAAEKVLARSFDDIPPAFRLRLELCRARVEMTRGRWRSAQERLNALLESVPDWYWESKARCLKGEISCWLGAPELGKNELEIVIDDERTDAALRIDAMLVVARSQSSGISDERRRFVEHRGTPLQRIALFAQSPAPGSREIAHALAEAESLSAEGHVIALSLVLARTLAREGERDGALECIERTWERAHNQPPPFPELGRIALCRALLHDELGGDSIPAWQAARQVANDVDLPAERVESYRSKNPVIARIFQTLPR